MFTSESPLTPLVLYGVGRVWLLQISRRCLPRGDWTRSARRACFRSVLPLTLCAPPFARCSATWSRTASSARCSRPRSSPPAGSLSTIAKTAASRTGSERGGKRGSRGSP
eukprot:763824-Prorocentrum_minimum.AAC.1